VRKLEGLLGRVLLERDTHTVSISEDGELLMGYARSMIEINNRAFEQLTASAIRGRVKLGASEDFVLGRLPTSLRSFRQSHPLVDIELTVGVSAVLTEKLQRRELDLVLGKRLPGEKHGEIVFRDATVWLAHPEFELDPTVPIPLIVYPAPSVSRTLALRALEEAGVDWRIVCSASSLSGQFAAAAAGLGVVPHARSLSPISLRELPAAAGLPVISSSEFVVFSAPWANKPSLALSKALLASSPKIPSLL
jgi:DNA-binding transcriptional LysR family regulator